MHPVARPGRPGCRVGEDQGGIRAGSAVSTVARCHPDRRWHCRAEPPRGAPEPRPQGTASVASAAPPESQRALASAVGEASSHPGGRFRCTRCYDWPHGSSSSPGSGTSPPARPNEAPGGKRFPANAGHQHDIEQWPGSVSPSPPRCGGSRDTGPQTTRGARSAPPRPADCAVDHASPPGLS